MILRTLLNIPKALFGSGTRSKASVPADALPLGTAVGPDHRVIGYLGSGGFGYTYLAERFDGHKVALKECFPFEYCRRNGLDVGLKAHDQFAAFDAIREGFKEEAEILAQLDHPNIVAGGAMIFAHGTVYIEMDMVSGGQLSNKISSWFGKLSRSECQQLGHDVLDALDVIHKKGFLHKDISPDNIILSDDGRPVLIDFGSATRFDAPPVEDPMLIVKIGYSPQEFYRPLGEANQSSDLYQLGATLRHCMTGERPIESVTRLHSFAQGKPDPLAPLGRKSVGAPEDFLTTIDQAMAIFPKDRIETAKQWQAKLKDA